MPVFKVGKLKSLDAFNQVTPVVQIAAVAEAAVNPTGVTQC